ncbi:sensor histidine kinase [Fulvivirga ligni]|uniref:sensor histidine kinase n=1 Tax=Fulvivirga ligni TaxID=2904246 RepID=UPI001F17FF1C|nr:HAMP domain-containing sensor histidine kinase [Fulvivirga ligni]UII22709.1 HAMP domain-containing histidine kinase [Fulvivirga ligni]
MNSKRFRLIGVAIVIIIVVTTALQLYYIQENYQQNKLRFENEVQQSLDNSVEEYYSEIAKSDILTFTDMKDIKLQFGFGSQPDSLINSQNFTRRIGKSHLLRKQALLWDNPDTVINDDSVHISFVKITKNIADSIMIDETNAIAMFKGRHLADSLEKLQTLTNKIVVSLTRDTLDFPMLNELLADELERKNLTIDYALIHINKDSITDSYQTGQGQPLVLSTFSKSTYLPDQQKLEMKYENAPLIILKKGLWNILFSVLFVLLISATLAFLYRTIKSQKELSEIKNDLINNITHEFKTPIATVSTAIEGIRNFNTENDPKKTEKYLQISHDQLIKLNLMVEKLLETATLDSEKLLLHLEPADLGQLLKQITEKYTTIHPGKQIRLTLKKQVMAEVDAFHFENAVSNLVDNAAKYGGDDIHITLADTAKPTILVDDNGGNIPKGQRDKIFEKFYRIPKGNVHDVKGFGIGLYYTKNIIEKHGGQVTLIADDQHTTFKIELP